MNFNYPEQFNISILHLNYSFELSHLEQAALGAIILTLIFITIAVIKAVVSDYKALR